MKLKWYVLIGRRNENDYKYISLEAIRQILFTKIREFIEPFTCSWQTRILMAKTIYGTDSRIEAGDMIVVFVATQSGIDLHATTLGTLLTRRGVLTYKCVS